MSAKHTPWVYRQFSNGPRCNGAIYNSQNKAVATLVNTENGPLLAAAPKLAEAVLALLDVVTPCNPQDPALWSLEECRCGRCEAVHNARAVLRNAGIEE